MSYHIYTTKGIILSEKPMKEADKAVFIFTRELGSIRALAIGARKGSSKRSPALTELSFGKFSLVRGKKDWRVTSATLEVNIYSEFKKNKKLLVSLAQILSLIDKLVQGEEKNKKLFDIFEDSLKFALENKLSLEEIKSFESITVAKILAELGYLGKDDIAKEYLNKDISKELLENEKREHRKIIVAINRGIRESGLIL
jgi:DNA repair protein RecO